MRSIRKFAYAAALGLSLLAVHPTLAIAEDAHGSFTLSTEVRCQKITLQPGKYTFSVKTIGPSDFLTLHRTDGDHHSVMLMASDVEMAKSNSESRLLLVQRGGQRFVSEIALPEYEMTLRFAVPEENPAKLRFEASAQMPSN
jgi:hypothetical protein